jgi:ABC-type glycerol-3-phosphate transport system permease component
MPIISKVGRKNTKTRLQLGLIYVLLSLGGITMVYPFALMIAGSSKSSVDKEEKRLIPSFLRDDQALWIKHVEGLFNEKFELMQACFDVPDAQFKSLELTDPNQQLVRVWQAYIDESDLPHYFHGLGYIRCWNSLQSRPYVFRDFQSEMVKRFDGDIHKMNEAFVTYQPNWQAFNLPHERYMLRRELPDNNPLSLAYQGFKKTRPFEERYYFSPEGFFRNGFLGNQYPGDIHQYNKEHGTAYTSYADVKLDRSLPTGPGRTEKEREDWLTFARNVVSMMWLRADSAATPIYRDFLRARFGTIDRLNRDYKTDYASFDEVQLIEDAPEPGAPFTDWDWFFQGWKDPDTGKLHILPAEMIRIHSVEFLFREFLMQKFKTIAAANGALGTNFEDWSDIMPPQRDAHIVEFLPRKNELRWEFVKRNYIAVFQYIIRHERGIINTVIYCVLAVVGALIVNPLAAYALSRFRPPSAYKLLLLMMLTMAFPPMVTQIPVFLMLRDFNMLNTFWALVLPGLANGYMIFLLKGFFDSLPRELYESAQIDGAGERHMFWLITMALSKPILAVVALTAFTLAYSNFMFALLLCQNQKMWTLMVWLLHLQTNSGDGVIFASLIIAAIPTFLVFAFCQNIIMRGIVVPVEK